MRIDRRVALVSSSLTLTFHKLFVNTYPQNSDMDSNSETIQAGGFENIREKFGRFRILIIGRANAGKTTILRAICNTTEDPEVFDGEGNKVRACMNTYG